MMQNKIQTFLQPVKSIYKNIKTLKVLGAGLMLMALFLIPAEADATHFRYGDISWRVVESDPSGRTIEFKINTGWRPTFIGGTNVNFGDGTSGSLSVTTVNVGGVYAYSTGTIRHTYVNNGTYSVSYSGCCKISNLANNSDDNWYIKTVVTVGSGNNSPVTTVPAIVNLQTNQSAATFTIPATDPDGDSLGFVLANTSQHNWPSGSTHPSGLSVNSSTGLVTFNTVGKSVGSLWNTAVAISDGNTYIVVDFIIQITQTSNPPEFDYNITPAPGHTYFASPGQTVAFDVNAFDTDLGSSVTISAIGAPSTASVSPAFGTSGNPIEHSFTWTPQVSEFGTYVINFIAQDNLGVQASTSISIVVSLKPQFDVPPTPAQGVLNIYSPGQSISFDVQASDPDPDDSVTVNKVEGKDGGGNKISLYSGATFSTPTTLDNPTSGAFSWTPQVSDWGFKPVVFTAEDTYGDKATHEVSLLINSLPVFTSTPVTNAVVGVPYTYNVTVSDSDVAYGDTLIVAGNTVPSWLTLTDNGDGTATLSGTPGLADAGSNLVILAAEDRHHSLYPADVPVQQFNILVDNCVVNAVAKNISLLMDSTGTVSITSDDVDDGSSATCGIASISVSPNSFSCTDTGLISAVLTVIDSNNNQATDTFYVNIINSALNINLSSPIYNGGYNISCNGFEDGSVYADVSGGCRPYGYSWANSSNTSDNISDLGAGWYKLTVTDANGQTATDSILLTEPPAVVADAGPDATVYYGYGPMACADLTGSASGGSGTYSSYNWSNSDTGTTINVCPSSTTVYTLTVTDSYGCTGSDSVTVNVVDVRCGKKMDKVNVCHLTANGKSHNICVSANAVPAHLAHGDFLGDCGGNKMEVEISGAELQMQVFPNPFTDVTVVQVVLPQDGQATLAVYNVQGRLMQTLHSGEVKGGLPYTFDVYGTNMAAGVYTARLTTAFGVENVKIILIK